MRFDASGGPAAAAFLPEELFALYLLYLDESGTHGGSPVFILGGLALHEQDTWHLQTKLSGIVQRAIPAGRDPLEFELHAAEIKSPRAGQSRQRRGGRTRPVSPWAQVDTPERLKVLQSGYRAIAKYACKDPAYPCAAIGAVVDRRSYADCEQRAYEEVLHKFDEMLQTQAKASGVHQRGIVIHDRRVVERDVQSWAHDWRQVAGRIGKLTHLSDVPFFADSRASRLIQAADFVSWALWRYYGLATADERWVKPLWPLFTEPDGASMHRLIHVHQGFQAGTCRCPPCASRLGA